MPRKYTSPIFCGYWIERSRRWRNSGESQVKRRETTNRANLSRLPGPSSQRADRQAAMPRLWKAPASARATPLPSVPENGRRGPAAPKPGGPRGGAMQGLRRGGAHPHPLRSVRAEAARPQGREGQEGRPGEDRHPRPGGLPRPQPPAWSGAGNIAGVTPRAVGRERTRGRDRDALARDLPIADEHAAGGDHDRGKERGVARVLLDPGRAAAEAARALA